MLKKNGATQNGQNSYFNSMCPPFHVLETGSTLERWISVWKMSEVPYCSARLIDRSWEDLPATQEHIALSGRDQNLANLSWGPFCTCCLLPCSTAVFITHHCLSGREQKPGLPCNPLVLLMNAPKDIFQAHSHSRSRLLL